jgi:hypothetical protein
MRVITRFLGGGIEVVGMAAGSTAVVSRRAAVWVSTLLVFPGEG